jgi:O-antigen/teichoic acid export membrane protein
MEMSIAVLKDRVLEEVPRLPLKWGSKAMCAVFDQACFAGSGFIISIMLARWLSSEAFGSFTVAYSIFLFLGTFYTQFLTAPMLVFGAGKYAGRFREYLGLLVCGHIAIAVVIGAALAVVAGALSVLGSSSAAHAFLGMAIAAPFLLLLWLVRSAFYAQLRPQWAAAGSAAHLAIVAAGVYGVYRLHLLSSASGFLIMGASSMIVGLLLIAKLQPQWRFDVAGPGRAFAWVRLARSGRRGGHDEPSVWGPVMVLRDHYQYAKWSSSAAATGWLAGNLHYFVLSATVGLGTVAAMRALDTALSPYFHFQLALSRLLVPVLGARSKSSSSGLFPYAIRISVLWGTLAVIAYALIRVFAPNVIAVLYGGAYVKYSPLLAWYGLIMISNAIGDPMLSSLAVMVRTDLIFLYQLVHSGALLIGYLVAGRYGLPGIIAVLIVVSFAMVPVAVFPARIVCTAPRSSATPESV